MVNQSMKKPPTSNSEKNIKSENELDILVFQNIISENKLQSLSSEKSNELKSICRELISEEKRGSILAKDYHEAKDELAGFLATIEKKNDLELLAKNHTKIEELRRSIDKLKEKIHHQAENVNLLTSRASAILSDTVDWDAITLKNSMKSAIKSFLKTP